MFELCAMANNLPSDISITCADRMILSILCDRADTEMHSFHGIDKLASRAGVCNRTVLRSIATLEKEGFIRVRRRRNKVNHYYVNYTRLLLAAKSGVTHSHIGGDTQSSEGESMSPEPVSESISESVSLFFLKIETKKTERLLLNKTKKAGVMVIKNLEELETIVKNKEPIPGLKPAKKISISSCWCKALSIWREEEGMSSTNLALSGMGSNQLNAFKKKCTGLDSHKVLTKCVINWGAFSQYVQTVVAGGSKPPFPNVGYLLTHAVHAQDFYTGKVYDSASSNKVTLEKKVVTPVSSNPTLDILKEIEEEEANEHFSKNE